MTWTENHGADELYDKFRVIRVRTGEEITGEFVFVLRPETDAVACVALATYAQAVEWRSPNLAAQIRARLEAISLRERRPS